LPQWFSDFLDRLGQFSNHFARHIARITVFGDHDQSQADWLSSFLAKSGERDQRAFAGHIRQILRSLSDDQKSNLWTRWTSSYWERRRDGRPPLSSPELETMAELSHTMPVAAHPFLHCDSTLALVQALRSGGVKPVTLRKLCDELGRLGRAQAFELGQSLAPDGGS